MADDIKHGIIDETLRKNAFDDILGQTHKDIDSRLAVARDTDPSWSHSDLKALGDRYHEGARNHFSKMAGEEGAKTLHKPLPKKLTPKLSGKEIKAAEDKVLKKWGAEHDTIVKQLESELQAAEDVRHFVSELPTVLDDTLLNASFKDLGHGSAGRMQHTNSVHASLKSDAEQLLADIKSKPVGAKTPGLSADTASALSKLDHSIADRFRFEAKVHDLWDPHGPTSLPHAKDLGGQGDWVKSRLNDLAKDAVADVRKGLGTTDYSATHVNDAVTQLDKSLTDIKNSAHELAQTADQLPKVSAEADQAWHDLTDGRSGIDPAVAEQMKADFRHEWLSGFDKVYADGRFHGSSWTPPRASDSPYQHPALAAQHAAAKEQLVGHYQHVLDVSEERNIHLSKLSSDVEKAAADWKPLDQRLKTAQGPVDKAALAKAKETADFREVAGLPEYKPAAADIKAVLDDVTADLHAEFKKLTKAPEPGTVVEPESLIHSWSDVHKKLIDSLPERFDARARGAGPDPQVTKAFDDHLSGTAYQQKPLPKDLVDLVKSKYTAELQAKQEAAGGKELSPADLHELGDPADRLAFAKEAEARTDAFMKDYDDAAAKRGTDIADDTFRNDGGRESWRHGVRDQLLDTYQDMRQLRADGLDGPHATDQALHSTATRLREHLRLEQEVFPGIEQKLEDAALRHDITTVDAPFAKALESLKKDLSAAVNDAFSHLPKEEGVWHTAVDSAAQKSRNAADLMVGERALANRVKYHLEVEAHLAKTRNAIENSLLHHETTLERVADELAAKIEQLAEKHLGDLRTGKHMMLGGDLDPAFREWRNEADKLFDNRYAHLDQDAFRQDAAFEAGEVFESKFGDHSAFDNLRDPKWHGSADVIPAFRDDWVALQDHFSHPSATDLTSWLATEKNTSDAFQKGVEKVDAAHQLQAAKKLEKHGATEEAPAPKPEGPAHDPAVAGTGRDGAGTRGTLQDHLEPEKLQDRSGPQQHAAQEQAGKDQQLQTQERPQSKEQLQAQERPPAKEQLQTQEQLQGQQQITVELDAPALTGTDRNASDVSLKQSLGEEQVPQKEGTQHTTEPARYRSWKYHSHLESGRAHSAFDSSTAASRLQREFSDHFVRAVTQEGRSDTQAAEYAAQQVRDRYQQAYENWQVREGLKDEFRSVLKQGPLTPRPGLIHHMLWNNDLSGHQAHWDGQVWEWYDGKLAQMELEYIEIRTAQTPEERAQELSPAITKAFRAKALHLTDNAVPMAELTHKLRSYFSSYGFQADRHVWSEETIAWYHAEQSASKAQAIKALERAPGSLAAVKQQYAEQMSLLREGARYREDPALLGEDTTAFTPVPSHVGHDDWRVPLMRKAEQRLQEKYEDLLDQAAHDAAYREQVQETVETWAQEEEHTLSPQQLEQLSDQASRIRNLESDASQDLRESLQHHFDALKGRPDLEAAHRSALAEGRAAFTRAITSWSNGHLPGTDAASPPSSSTNSSCSRSRRRSGPSSRRSSASTSVPPSRRSRTSGASACPRTYSGATHSCARFSTSCLPPWTGGRSARRSGTARKSSSPPPRSSSTHT